MKSFSVEKQSQRNSCYNEEIMIKKIERCIAHFSLDKSSENRD